MPRFTSLLPSLATAMLQKGNQHLDEILIRDRMRVLGIDRESAETVVATEVAQEMGQMVQEPIYALRIH